MRAVSQEQYLVETALELVREIARHFDQLSHHAADEKEKKRLTQNANRAYSSVDHLKRVNCV